MTYQMLPQKLAFVDMEPSHVNFFQLFIFWHMASST